MGGNIVMLALTMNLFRAALYRPYCKDLYLVKTKKFQKSDMSVCFYMSLFSNTAKACEFKSLQAGKLRSLIRIIGF